MAETPISLYIDLEAGEKADLEVIARAALEFAAAIKDIAAILDPTLEVRVEFASGTEGSLSLNSLIKSIGIRPPSKKMLGAVALTVVIYFQKEIREHFVDKALDYLFPGFVEEQFSPEERKDIRDIVQDAIKNGLGQPHIQAIYRELERDPAIAGVGATTKSGVRPDTIIPKSEFPARGTSEPTIEEHPRERHRTPEIVVTLIKPVLEPGKRAWRFRDAHGEFSAVMDDQEFLEKVLSGQERVPMMQGLRFRVKIRIDEKFSSEGVWVPIARRILKVVETKRPPQQSSLRLPDMRPDEDDDNEHQ